MDSKLNIKVIFLSQSDGGRTVPPQVLSNGGYRPHFVTEINSEASALKPEDYLGVQFVDGPDSVVANEEYSAVVRLLYEIDYTALKPGTKFRIVEGPKIVGRGIVI